MSDPKVFLNGKPVEHPHEDHHHVTPVWQFTAVFIALLFLTILTYAVSFAGLGPASLPVAMAVAICKGSLVVLFFMHLAYEDRFYAFVFVVSLIFIAIFFTFTLFDMSTTDELNEEAGIEFQRHVMDQAEALENPPEPPAAEGHGAAEGEAKAEGEHGGGH